jgi:pyridoxamine 5'-phosphate oxidase
LVTGLRYRPNADLELMPIDPADLDPDPFHQLEAWLAEAEASGLPLANAFALATTGVDGDPSVRMVLLRGLDREGLRFYTNRRSRKGRDLAGNARAAAAFHWAPLGRQVRAAGPVLSMSDAESTAYWTTRPRASRLSAWASEQGSWVESRAILEAQVVELDARFPGEAIPLPPFWGGYRLVPEVFEFWEGRADRLHDRVEYQPSGDGTWRRRRLQP